MNQNPHLILLLDRAESIGKRVRALAKNAIGDPDQDYWLSDLINEIDRLHIVVAEVRHELIKSPSLGTE